MLLLLENCVVVRLNEARMASNALYPYVVRKEYLEYQAEAVEGLVRSLGRGIFVALAEDLNGLVKSLSLMELKALGLSPDKAWSAAIANLEALLKSGVIRTQLFPGGPRRTPFILVGGHWGAASCALLPRLFDLAAKNLEAAELCFSIPHSSALLIFPKGDQAYRAAMREMIRAQEGAERKPLTLDFFTFDSTGPVPLGDE
jgi:hypothetical protein